jgi:hypothetical protein
MICKTSGARAPLAAGVLAAAFTIPTTSNAQTAAERQILAACANNMSACANLAQQLRGAPGVGGDAGASAVLNAAAAAANAAGGQMINPMAYGAAPTVSAVNPTAAIAASQQYGQCVKSAGQNAQAAQACMRLLPPEWAALGRQAQAAYLANPAAANAALGQVMNNAQAVASGNYNQAQPPQNNPFGSALAAMAGQVAGQMGGAGARAAQAAGLAGTYGAPAPAYNPVNNANAVAAAAGGYQACVMSVGVTNTAGVQACQQRFFGGGAPGVAPPAPAPAAQAAPYSPFAALGR